MIDTAAGNAAQSLACLLARNVSAPSEQPCGGLQGVPDDPAHQNCRTNEVVYLNQGPTSRLNRCFVHCLWGPLAQCVQFLYCLSLDFACQTLTQTELWCMTLLSCQSVNMIATDSMRLACMPYCKFALQQLLQTQPGFMQQQEEEAKLGTFQICLEGSEGLAERLQLPSS